MSIHDCRFLIEVQGDYKKVCRIVFGKKDASLYLLPYGRQKRYLWGEGTIPEGTTTATFPHANPAGEVHRPKLSIHESGQVHVKLGEAYKAGPLRTKPLWEFRGEHLAGLTIDSIESLPSAGKPKPKPKSPDLVLGARDIQQGDVLRFLSKKNDVWFPKLKPVPVMGTEKENHTSWERYYRVSDCSSSSRNNWYLGR